MDTWKLIKNILTGNFTREPRLIAIPPIEDGNEVALLTISIDTNKRYGNDMLEVKCHRCNRTVIQLLFYEDVVYNERGEEIDPLKPTICSNCSHELRWDIESEICNVMMPRDY